MRYIGVDPGKDGAVAVLIPNDGSRSPALSTVRVADTPVFKAGAGGKREYDVQGMRGLLLDMTAGNLTEALVVLERQQAMPKQGVVSTFSTGMGYGLWIGLLAGLQIPYKLVHPTAWRKALMSGEPRTAEASVGVALRFYPTARDLLVGPKGGFKDGRADAVLLARYGMLGL